MVFIDVWCFSVGAIKFLILIFYGNTILFS
jgi:hypothetical protein